MSLQERMGKAIIHKVPDKQENACYVLITCRHPSEDGKMEVEFTYDGDEVLAMYLLETAQDYINEQIEVKD